VEAGHVRWEMGAAVDGCPSPWVVFDNSQYLRHQVDLRWQHGPDQHRNGACIVVYRTRGAAVSLPAGEQLKTPGPQRTELTTVIRGHFPFDKVASGNHIQFMRSVGLKTLKTKLSKYVRLAAGGETVLVTDRDRVVAEIGPPNPVPSPLLSDALLLDAVRQGWMTPPISVGRGPPARKPVMKIDELLSNLQRDRTDR
jgi:antitoxin (DNA-binding transcriptional repressor) of toxin-antitoxin stability system